jgi:glycine oxidase
VPIPRSSPDAVVIGGGVIGLAIGWRAARRGLRVTLIERGEPGAATSYVAAGMIAPIAEAEPSEQPLLALGMASAEAYPEFIRELEHESGLSAGYLPCGTLMTARDADEAQALVREQAMRERLGLAVRRVSPTAARRLEPALAPTLRGALEFVDDRAIDPRALTAALAEAFTQAGGRLLRAEARSLTIAADGAVTGVELGDGTHLACEQVVVAAGPWSGALAGLPPEARIPVRPVKGQILRLRDPAGPGLLSRVLRMQPGYVVPRGDGRYVLGATMEERGFDTTVTAGPVFELLRDAIELLPGLSELVIEEVSAGIRPGTPDNLPVLGPGALAGLLWATGHFRHGILLAPVTAELLVAGLCGEPAGELARACAPERFARVPV